MVKLVSAKCPSCGAPLKLSKDEERVKCDFCHNTIIVEEAITCYKLKVSGTVSVEGITTNSELIEAANELLDMNEYLKAKRKFLEFSEKCPDNYQGWLGLLICRTRNFKIRDNNIMFENDVNKYYEHFKRTASKEVFDEYFETIDRYFDPEKYKRMEEEERLNKQKQQLEEQRKKEEEQRKLEIEEKEKRRLERKKNPTYNLVIEVANKCKNILFKIGCGILYFCGGVLILGGLLGSSKSIVETILTILIGLSLFKFIYVFIGNKLKIEKVPLIIFRIFIPIWLLFILVLFLPPSSTDETNKITKEEKPCITFLNEGKKYKVICVNNGEKIETPEAPIKKGYVFSHWATHQETTDGSEKYDFSKPITKSQSVFAHFNKVE